MKIKIIASMSENRVIGKDGKIPWHIPQYIEKFNLQTKGNVVVMGKNLYESLGQPIRSRVNIVLTTDKRYKTQYPNVHIFHSMKSCLNHCLECQRDQIFFIGGKTIFDQAIIIADEIELTIVKKTYLGDKFFPEINNCWEKYKEEFDETNKGIILHNITYRKKKENNSFEDLAEPKIEFSSRSTIRNYKYKEISENDRVRYNRNRVKQFSKMLYSQENKEQKAIKSQQIQTDRDRNINDYRKYIQEEKRKKEFRNIVNQACIEVERNDSNIGEKKHSDAYMKATKKNKKVVIPVKVKKRKKYGRRSRNSFGQSNTMVLKMTTDIDTAKKLRENTVIGKVWKTVGQVRRRFSRQEKSITSYIIMLIFIICTIAYLISAIFFMPKLNDMKKQLENKTIEK